MAVEVRSLDEYPLLRYPRYKSRMEQETRGPGHRSPHRVQGHQDLLNISRVHLYSARGIPFSQGHLEKEIRTAIRQAELKLEKRPRHWQQSHGDSGPQKESVVPGIVDLELIQDVLRGPKPSGTYRFGRLSHHSFFSRHHPHPHHVTHIQDLTGKPVCIVRNKFSPLPHSSFLSHCLTAMPTISIPIGDPQSNRNPRLSYEAWKKELKELASRVAMFTTETEQKNKEKEEPPREQGAKYSAETGRLIPASAQALSRRSYHHGQRSHLSSRDGGVQASVLQDQELLVSPTLGAEAVAVPVPRLPVFQTALGPGLSWECPHQQLSGKPPPWEPAAWAPGPSASRGSCPFLYPGTSLSDSSNGFAECHPVLAAVCYPHGEGPCSETPADGRVSASPSTLSLHFSRKALEPTSSSSRSTSREATAVLQSIPEEDENITFTDQGKTRVHGKSTSPAAASVRRPRGESVQAAGKEPRGLRLNQTTLPFWSKLSPPSPAPPPPQQPRLVYHKQSTK